MNSTTGTSSNATGTGDPNPNKSIKNAILVRRNQKSNPLLKMFQNVAWQYDDILADYEVGRTTGILFLSLKYHRLHPDYCYGRIQALEKRYLLRILLILCDVGDQHEQPIRELTKSFEHLQASLPADDSIRFEECALYLQTYKAYENRPPDSIKERVDKDYNSVLRSALTSVKGVNKTDVTTLRTHFGSFSRIAHASAAELSNCPGIGPTKVRRLNDAFNQPFRKTSSTNQNKGKEKETFVPPLSPKSTSTASTRLRPSAAPRRTINGTPPSGGSSTDRLRVARRSQSPDWDIELDLNNSDSEQPPRAPQLPPWELNEATSRPSTLAVNEDAEANGTERQYSPDWDIEVDEVASASNASDPESISSPEPVQPTKKRRTDVFAA